MPRELWEILDSEGNKTGRTVERGQPMSQDEYHLVVHVWIRNSKGEYLISKRTPNKTPYPNLWEPTGGSAVVGDDSLQAALREVQEEMGITLAPENGKHLMHTKRQQHDFPDFLDVWLFEQDVDISTVVYQPEEVCGAKWATPEQIRAMIETSEFVPVCTYLDEVFNSEGEEDDRSQI